MYKAILIDMFNLCYKHAPSGSRHIDVANSVVDYINNEVKPRLEDDGSVYLLFDPLPKSDLGMSKNFKYSTTRQNILKSYKKNRESNPTVLAAARLLRKYYTYRGDRLKVCISNEFEADDFVEGIIENNPDGRIAMITTDSDWARYISDRVEMINGGFDKPYTKEEYYIQYGMYPTVLSVTLRKSIFGDKSDGVEPVLTKKNNIFVDTTNVITTLIGKVSEENISFEDFEERLRKINHMTLFNTKERSSLDEIFFILMSTDECWGSFNDNLRVIKCRCKNVAKYTFTHPANKGFNDLMETTLGRVKPEDKNHKFSFAQIKI